MSGLSVEVFQEDRVTVAVLAGEVDIANAPRLTEEILAEMPDASRGLVLDLARLAYLDSAGVRSIFDIARTLELRDQAFAIVVAEGSPLRSVLKVTRAEEIASLCPSRGEALNSVVTHNPQAEL